MFVTSLLAAVSRGHSPEVNLSLNVGKSHEPKLGQWIIALVDVSPVIKKNYKNKKKNKLYTSKSTQW